jgi:hypothetical protein
MTRGGKRGTRRAQNRHGGAPRGERPASWDARRLARRLACRVTCTPHGCSAEHPNVSRRSAHPQRGVSEAKRQSPDAAMRARERDGLFDMVKNAASDGRPHASRRIAAHNGGGRPAPVSRCNAPQLRAKMRDAFGRTNSSAIWPNQPKWAARVWLPNDEPSVVGRDQRVTSYCFRLFLTMERATQVCVAWHRETHRPRVITDPAAARAWRRATWGALRCWQETG